MIFGRLYVEAFSFFRMDGPHVTVAQGELLGKLVETHSGRYYSFQGIPYAKPPLGSLRFKPPVEAESWAGVRDATTEGNSCPQLDYYNGAYLGGEDCLYLNVYTPSLPIDDDQLPPNKPVVVFVHGGGFTHGSGNSDMFGPDYLAAEDVVLVTINYRIGPLGFLCLHIKDAPGNAGLRDQILALSWVKKNIPQFGGDSDNITFAGQDAGAVSISQLITSPLTDGLFHKVLLSSASSFSEWGIEDRPINRAYNLAKSLGCESDEVEDVLAFLHTVTAEELIRHTNNIFDADDHLVCLSPFTPVVEKLHDGVDPVLLNHPRELAKRGSIRKVPFLIGYNTIESARHFYNAISKDGFTDDLQHVIPREFGLDVNSSESIEIWGKIKQFYFGDKHFGAETLIEAVDLTSDILVTVGINKFIDAVIKNGDNPVYFYRFGYFGANHINATFLKSVGLMGAANLDEAPYIFKVSLFDRPEEMNIADARIKEQFVSFWANFAKYSNPTPSENELGTITWLPVTNANKYYMDINHEITLSTEPDKERIDFWKGLYDKHAVKNIQPIAEELLHRHRVSVVKEIIDSTDSVEENAIKLETHSEIVPQTNDEDGAESKTQVANVPKAEIKPERITVKVEEYNGHANSNGVDSKRKLNDIIRANDPPEDDLPKNIGVNKFIHFFEKLGTKN